MHERLGMFGCPPKEAKRLLQLSVVKFIFTHLASWRDDPGRPAETNEDRLTNQLCAYLSDKTEFFSFQSQEPQMGTSSIDIAAKPKSTTASLYQGSIYVPLILFESKRLPCPDNPHVREKEYVIRKDRAYGGIQRFKNERHAADFTVAGMIGYIQQHDIALFFGKVNAWLSELAHIPPSEASGLLWNHELLEMTHILKSEGIAQLNSEHKRPTKEPIALFHLWVCMNHIHEEQQA